MIIAFQQVMVKPSARGVAWPAQRFIVSPKANMHFRHMKGYKALGEYVEYFNERDKFEYAFVAPDLIDELNIDTVPRCPPPKMQASLSKVQEEKSIKAAIVQDLLLLTQHTLFTKIHSKYSWIGLRVKVLMDSELESVSDNSNDFNFFLQLVFIHLHINFFLA
jgi:hypothetical protein